MRCIAVLTRGYKSFSGYGKLITRNRHIEKHLTDKSVHVIIFHEDNITIPQQRFIQRATPLLVIMFINVKNGVAFRKEKEKTVFQAAKGFGIGYRHMCSFWFVDSWSFVDRYDLMLRIDEDCFVDFDIDATFVKLHSSCFLSAIESNDLDDTTIGMNALTRSCLSSQEKKYPPSGPYTNVFGINLTMVRSNHSLKSYIQAVDHSNCIYSHRWGDLPLWGEAIHYIFGRDALCIDPTMHYYHESHHAHINP